MNLGGWGPSDECRGAIAEVQREIQNRFGIRRFRACLRRGRLAVGGCFQAVSSAARTTFGTPRRSG